MTEYEKKYCSTCRDFKNCAYIPRHLERKCTALSDWSSGYDAALADITNEIKARLETLWGEIPYASDVIDGNITKEQAGNLGRFAALESLEAFIENLGK